MPEGPGATLLRMEATGLSRPAMTGYRGEGNTVAKDAYVIADQARMRQDLNRAPPRDDVTWTWEFSPRVVPIWLRIERGRSTGTGTHWPRFSLRWGGNWS